MSDEVDKKFWEERYRGHTAQHDRPPNEQLMAEAEELDPGNALDAGCGEGADTIWLASRGWRVTAVDFITNALQRGKDRVDRLGSSIASRIDWVEADLTTWKPTEERFDLVFSHYVHVPSEARDPLFRRLATAVAPGGTLLMVGHDPSELHTPASRGSSSELYVTSDEIAALLDPQSWEIVVSEARRRPDHRSHTHGDASRDAVLRARKRRDVGPL